MINHCPHQTVEHLKRLRSSYTSAVCVETMNSTPGFFVLYHNHFSFIIYHSQCQIYKSSDTTEASLTSPAGVTELLTPNHFQIKPVDSSVFKSTMNTGRKLESSAHATLRAEKTNYTDHTSEALLGTSAEFHGIFIRHLEFVLNKEMRTSSKYFFPVIGSQYTVVTTGEVISMVTMFVSLLFLAGVIDLSTILMCYRFFVSMALHFMTVFGAPPLFNSQLD